MISTVQVKEIKVYIAGKVSPNSVFGTSNWRDGFCTNLSEKTGFQIINLDPLKSHEDFNLDEKNSRLIFGRDCFMIRLADLVIVHLTNDISVGGSQEMLIAKYYRKPLIGIAPKGGKFNQLEKNILGRVYTNWIHPFVKVPCDVVVEDINEAAVSIKDLFSSFEDMPEIKDLSIIDESADYYEKQYHHLDKFLHFD